MRSNAAYLTAVFLLLFIMTAGAQEPDTAYLARVQDTVDRYYRLHPRKRIPMDYRNFEVTPLFGVMYTQETGVVAMGGFMGGYRTSADTLLPMSSVGVAALVSTNLSLAGAVTGVRYAPAGKFVIEYTARVNSSPRYFWGLGYDCAADDSNRGSFTSRRVRVRADFLYRGDILKTGGFAGYDYYHALDFSDPAAVSGHPVLTQYLTAGARLDLDTRDNASVPSRGLFLNIEPSVSIPLTEALPFFRTKVTLDMYLGLWSGGVLAVDLYGDLSTDGAPWTMWPESGGDVRMRGYYQGRYRDRNLLSVQVELRQTVYRSHGVAVWAGAGNVFPAFGRLRIKNTLPTYGAGYRFTFLGLVLRLDAGFGLRGQWAVTAGVSHSF